MWARVLTLRSSGQLPAAAYLSSLAIASRIGRRWRFGLFEVHREELDMPREKSYEDMTEDERDQHERDNLEDEYYKTQNEMDSPTGEDD